MDDKRKKMDALRQRLVEKILAQVDPASLEPDAEGIDLGQKQGEMALVKELVAAFAANLAEEEVRLGAEQRRTLMGQVVEDVLTYEQRAKVAGSLEVQPTVERLVRRGTWNAAVVDYLRACIDAGRSVLVSGEAGAGKSTLLGVMTALAPGARIVSVEGDSPLTTEHEHVVRLRGEGGTPLEWALQLSPDRLVFDEVTPDTALVALQAMTAVPALATIQGTSARSALGRLVTWVLEAAPGLPEPVVERLIANHVDVIVNVARQYQGAHRVTEVVEVLPDAAAEAGMRAVTLVALNPQGELAQTGTASAFVSRPFLQQLPHIAAPAELPVRREAVEAAPAPVAAPPPPAPAPAAPPERKGLFGRRGPKGPTLDTAVSAAARGAAIAATSEMTDYSQVAAPPIVQKMTTYLQGDDLFDASYAIEDGPEFLGEMGVGLTEEVDDGPPRQMAGLEAWMFDKETLDTPTAVMLSEGAYADETRRDMHAAKGEVVAATPGARLVLDTGVLRMEARLMGIMLGADGRTIEQATIELAAWRSEGESAAIEVPVPMVPEMPPPEPPELPEPAVPPVPVEEPTLPEPTLVEPEAPPAPAPAPQEPQAEKKGGLLGGLFGKRGPKGPTLDTAVSAAARGAAIAATSEMTDYSQAETPPVVQKMTTYLQGDDLYDVSFAVEDGPEFLGEMGVGLTEEVDDGPPRRVAGLEAWMFDKETLDTPTAVILSEAAFADEATRMKYEMRGDVIPAIPGERLVLDTGVLRLEARVGNVVMDRDGKSFEQATVELAAWRGEGAS